MPAFPSDPAKPHRRLKAALAALRHVQEYTEHQPICPQFDRINFRGAPCSCWKRKVARVLSQADREDWLKKP